MKKHMPKTVRSSIFLSSLIISVFASHPVAAAATTSGKMYVGIFGGGGSSNQFPVSQYGTAFYTEAEGGPLAVNAFGNTNSRSSGFYGAQIGYQVPAILLSPHVPWMLVPAVELEGYAFSNTTYTGSLTNNTARLPEHDFVVTYPMRRSVFLVNSILSLNNPCYLFHPYIGMGIGGAIVKISGADAAQISPPEAGINHYNANTSDTDPTFAGQIKAGLSYDINKYVSVFAEYRWLYLSSTHFSFGSTVYPTHVETSSWQVKVDPQRYSLGAIGIRVSV